MIGKTAGAVATAVLSIGMLASPAHASAPSMIRPAGIDASGAADDTAALQTLLNGLPDGSTLSFPAGGKYRIEGTLLVKDKHDLTIDGNGALFFATSVGDRTRSQWSFQGGSNILVQDVNVKGANPNAGTGEDAYVASLEAQHAFQIAATNGIELDHVSATDVYGDFVYIGAHQGVLSRNVYVHDSVFERNGRQGISVTGGDGVRIFHNTITDTRRATFDLEPNGPGWGALDVDIEYNTIGPGRLNFLSADGSGPIADITIAHNTINRDAKMSFGGTAGAPRGPVTIADNVAADAWGSAAGTGVLRFSYVNGITVTNNIIPVQSGRADYGVKATDACDVVVRGNTFANALPENDITSGPDCPTVKASADPEPAQTSTPTSRPTHETPVPPTAPAIALPTVPTPGQSLIAPAAPPTAPAQADAEPKPQVSAQPSKTSMAGKEGVGGLASVPSPSPPQPKKAASGLKAAGGGRSNPSASRSRSAINDAPQATTDVAATGQDIYLNAADESFDSPAPWRSHIVRRALYVSLAAMLLLLLGLRLRKRDAGIVHRSAVRTVRHHPGLATIALRGPEMLPPRRVL